MKFLARSALFFICLPGLVACHLKGQITDLEGESEVSPDEILKIEAQATSVTEGDAIAFNILLDKKAPKDVVVNWKLSGVSSPQEDFAEVTGQIEIKKNEKLGLFTLSSKENALYDQNRVFSLALTPEDKKLVQEHLVQVTVVDDESPPVISFDVESQNLNEAAGGFSILVRSSVASKLAVTLPYTISGTASAGSDFSDLTSGNLTLAAGQTSATLSGSLVNDTVPESAETIVISLAEPLVPFGTLGTAKVHTTTLVDNDTFNLSINDVTQTEGGIFTFSVSLSAVSTQTVTVNWGTANDTALSGVHYTLSSGSLSFSPGDLVKTFTVASSDNATVCETTKQFKVNLSSPTNATLSDAEGIGSISDSDRPTISVGDVAGTEGTTINVPATLSAACATHTVSFNWATSDGTAVSPGDYTAVAGGSASFAPGVSSINLPVVSTSETTFEADETLTVTISSPVEAGLGTASATVTITNDDAAPVVAITTTATVISAVTTNGLTVTVPFTGDDDADATATLYYCNITDLGLAPRCDFTLGQGTSVAMTRGASSFSVTLTGLTSPNDPGDHYFFDVVVNDTDGVTAPSLQTTPTLDIASPVALFESLPPNNSSSNIAALNTRVYGQGVVAYLYKLGVAASTDCSSATGYVTVPSTSTPITNSISGLADGFVKVCLRGQSSGGTIQALGSATERTWYKDTAGVARTISLSNRNMTLFDGSVATATATFVMSGTKPYDVVVNYGLGTSTMVAPNDFDFVSAGTVTIPAGQTTTTKDIVLAVDSAAESDEMYYFSIQGTNSTEVRAGFNESHYRMDSIDEDRIRVLGTDIGAGGGFSCAIFSGDLKCWGHNTEGEVGDGTTTQRTAPTAVDVGVRYAQVSTGTYHACGITIQGVLKCWGYNNLGQVGDGTQSPRYSPVIVDPGVTYSRIAAGGEHTCGITTSGVLKCWGSNNTGQVGDNSATMRTLPTIIDTGVSYRVTDAGKYHSCGVTTSGVLKCWGYNPNGQVGDNSTTQRNAPVEVNAGVNYISVDVGGSHSCGIVETTNELKCWGNGTDGRIGDNASIQRNTPVVVDTGVAYSSVSAGEEHTCGVTTGGILKCWGNNLYGRLGDDSSTSRVVPKVIEAGSTFSKVSAGFEHTCALQSDGVPRCWGRNDFGQMGDGTKSQRTSPIDIDNTTVYSEVSAGYRHTCGFTSGGVLKCWGANTYGRLGDGTTIRKASPVIVSQDEFAVISAGFDHSCGITKARTLKCWGYNLNGQIGDGTQTTRVTPVIVDGGVDYVSVSTGYAHTCAITTDGDLKCWGYSGNGQVGDGTTTQRLLPVVVNAGTKYKSVSAGTTANPNTCGITMAGVLKCWGWNGYGQIGDNSVTERPSPVVVDAGTPYQQVSVGGNHTCGVTSTNVLKCWGRNNYGQGGDGTAIQKIIPTIVDSGTSYSMVSAGLEHACALTIGNELKCWGRNNYNQVGDGTTSQRNAPVVIQSGTSYKGVSAGSEHTCGLLNSNGALRCWGYNNSGQLGDMASFHSQYRPIYPRDSMPGVSNTNAIYLNGLAVTQQVGSSFDVSVNYEGDLDTNAVVTAYYCNQTDSPNCDPLVGSSFTLTRGAGVFTGNSSALSSPNDATDILKVVVTATDPVSVSGNYSTTVEIP